MAGAKIIVMYPMPTDIAAFENAHASKHIPMAGPIFQEAGATKVVLTTATGATSGAPAFHRIAEIHFPSMEKLQACVQGKGRDAFAHAHEISSGGPPVVLIAEEETVTF